MLLYNSKYTEIHYHEKEKLVEAVWHGFAPSMAYRKSMDTYIEVIRGYEVQRWLWDYREAGIVRPTDLEWAATVWAPVFMPLAARLKKVAKVNATDMFNQVSFDSVRKSMGVDNSPFPFREFDDYREARAWVLSEE